MFCEHALDHDAEDLVRDAFGRVLCPLCTAYCETCGRPWFGPALAPGGLCAPCAAARPAPAATRAHPPRGDRRGHSATHGRALVHLKEGSAMIIIHHTEDVPAAPDPTVPARARDLLRALAHAGKHLADCEKRVSAAKAARDAAERAVCLARDELCGLVRGCGGSVALPELQRPLHVKAVQTVDYMPARLLPWLLNHAPEYVRESRTWTVDRRRLKQDVRVRGGRAWLPGARRAVPGMRITTQNQLVIPRAVADEQLPADAGH